MPGVYLVPQGLAIVFTTGVLFGIYLITASFANRWLIFTDEGWQRRKNVHWLMVVITNTIFLLSVASMGLTTHKAMSQAIFVEEGGRAGDWVNPAWDPIATVSIWPG